MPSNWIDELLYHVYESGTQSIGKWVRDDHIGKPMNPAEAKAIIESKLIEARTDEVEKAKHNIYHTSDMYRENPSIYFAERLTELNQQKQGGAE